MSLPSLQRPQASLTALAILATAAWLSMSAAHAAPPPGVPPVQPPGQMGSDSEDDDGPGNPHIAWINHFALLPGGAEVTTTYNSTSSGVGGGLTGLVIHSSTTGDTFADEGNKVVHMALDLPKNTIVTGVRVCYELSNAASFITQVRLAQVQNPPATATVMLDDGTDLVNPGPVCADTTPTFIKSEDGSLLLSLRTYFASTDDVIVVRAVGLHVK